MLEGNPGTDKRDARETARPFQIVCEDAAAGTTGKGGGSEAREISLFPEERRLAKKP